MLTGAHGRVDGGAHLMGSDRVDAAPPDQVALAREWLRRHAHRLPAPHRHAGSNSLAVRISKWGGAPVERDAVRAAAHALGFIDQPMKGQRGWLFNIRVSVCGPDCAALKPIPSRAGCNGSGVQLGYAAYAFERDAASCAADSGSTHVPDAAEVAIASAWLARHARRRANPSARFGSRWLSTLISRWADQPVSRDAVCAAARALGLDERPARTRPGVVLFAARARACGVECELYSAAHSRASCEAATNTPISDGSTHADLARFDDALTRATIVLEQLTAATARAVDVLERVERLVARKDRAMNPPRRQWRERPRSIGGVKT